MIRGKWLRWKLPPKTRSRPRTLITCPSMVRARRELLSQVTYERLAVFELDPEKAHAYCGLDPSNKT